MKNIKLISFVVIVTLILIIIIQNSQDVTFNIFFWDFNMPLYMIILSFFVLPAVGYLLARFLHSGKSDVIKKTK